MPLLFKIIYFKTITNDAYLVGKFVTYELIRYLFKKINKKFLTKNITPHTFRHTRAIHLLKSGVPVIMIRDLLGHESVITTEEYAKVLEEDKFKAIEEASPNEINNKLDDWNDDKDLLNQLLSL